jgi:hypothetical protein
MYEEHVRHTLTSYIYV